MKKESSTTKKTLWSGGPQPDSQDYNGGNYKDRYKVLAEIRKALENGDRQKAKQLAERNLVGPNNAQYGRYLAFGDVFMVFNNQKKGLENVTDYHRGLDITKAITTTSYIQDGTNFKRETFSSYPDDVTVTHLSKKGDKTLDFTLWNSLTEDLRANGDYSGNIRSINKGQSRPIQMVSCSRGLSKTTAFNLPLILESRQMDKSLLKMVI